MLEILCIYTTKKEDIEQQFVNILDKKPLERYW